jgi:hypothetical protein
MPSDTHFNITSIGWDALLIEKMLDRIQESSDFRFTHIVHTDIDAAILNKKSHRSDVIPVRKARGDPLPPPDLDLLASLEADGIPTIHNMILGDRILRKLPNSEALSYATFLAQRITSILKAKKPDVVIGGFDSLDAGIGLAVCRSLDIPWVAMAFTTIPRGYLAFCDQICPDAQLKILRPLDESLQHEATEALVAFESLRSQTPAFVSAHSIGMVLKKLPTHLSTVIQRTTLAFNGFFDRFTKASPMQMSIQYMRKRRNTLLFPNKLFVRQPPADLFALFALHMQPESSIDAWAPFFSDQFHLIQQIVRAMPPNMRLLVKVHISDADNYSPRQLRQLLALPNVQLVHPTASSRDFINQAGLIFGIQGTICLESALLGKPVLMFGESPYLHFPSVERTGRITDLSKQIRAAISKPKPDRSEILAAYVQYLARFMPAKYNDWTKALSDEDVARFTACFDRLREYTVSNTRKSVSTDDA